MNNNELTDTATAVERLRLMPRSIAACDVALFAPLSGVTLTGHMSTFTLFTRDSCATVTHGTVRLLITLRWCVETDEHRFMRFSGPGDVF